jgi:S-adenosylmethionine synthetase
MKKGLFTSESVGPGHPDKICDQISDAILDAVLTADPKARVAIETAIKDDNVFLLGEVTSKAKINYASIAKKVLKDIGMQQTFTVVSKISKQSKDISQGVDTGGAGDQGMVFGYACRETPELMPLPISLSHSLLRKLDSLRRNPSNEKNDFSSKIMCDSKCQVTIDYSNYNPMINTVVMAVQHKDKIDLEKFREYIAKNVILPVASEYKLNKDFKVIINGTGKFVVGGPFSDSGLTGRKIIVDTYGGAARHGGGAFSGKDSTKVDRSGAYAARWVAKNIVATNLADECEIQISYAIGRAEPVSIRIDTFGTNAAGYSEEYIEKMVKKLFPLTPKWIESNLDLRKPIYQQTAVFGHFGRRDIELPWEQLTLSDKIKDYLKKN